jgi:hypothetical protein
LFIILAIEAVLEISCGDDRSGVGLGVNYEDWSAELYGVLDLSLKADGAFPPIEHEDVKLGGTLKHVKIVLAPGRRIGWEVEGLRAFVPVDDGGVDMTASPE